MKRSILFVAASFVLTGTSLGLAAPEGLAHGPAHYLRRITHTTGYSTNWADTLRPGRPATSPACRRTGTSRP